MGSCSEHVIYNREVHGIEDRTIVNNDLSMMYHEVRIG